MNEDKRLSKLWLDGLKCVSKFRIFLEEYYDIYTIGITREKICSAYVEYSIEFDCPECCEILIYYYKEFRNSRNKIFTCAQKEIRDYEHFKIIPCQTCWDETWGR